MEKLCPGCRKLTDRFNENAGKNVCVECYSFFRYFVYADNVETCESRGNCGRDADSSECRLHRFLRCVQAGLTHHKLNAFLEKLEFESQKIERE
ncbi:unnamed protein product [Caenorhabditis sp. 36 PRJEB53466]|nr:unnamed protein product [Caenorhabditis sp. 36 PRJEB53466]